MRDLYCGEVNESHIGQELTLCGWINKKQLLVTASLADNHFKV